MPWVKRPEARALLLSTTFLVQILEDVPQSVIGSLFVSTMLAKAGANCDSCFFDNAPAGVAIDDPSCYVLQVEKVSEAASRRDARASCEGGRMADAAGAERVEEKAAEAARRASRRVAAATMVVATGSPTKRGDRPRAL